MSLFRPGTHVKFHLLPAFDSKELRAALHVTADGFYYGLYFPSHVTRSPEVKRDGEVVQAAHEERVAEHVVPLKPSGENLMLPNLKSERFERAIFTMEKIDLATLHECDHLDHVPPGRQVDPAWKPDAQRKAEEAAKTVA